MQNGGSMLSSLSLTGSDGIVRTSGNQTIRGVKTFTNEIFASKLTDRKLVRLGCEDIGADNYCYVDLRSGGTSTNYDTRLLSINGSSVVGSGIFNIESGTITLDSKTTNTIKSGGVAKITIALNYTNIINDFNTVSTSLSTGVNILEATGLNGSNVLKASGSNGFNSLMASGVNGYNTITATGALGNTITANYGTNDIQALNNNTLTTLSSNILKVGLDPKITTSSSINTIENTTNTIISGGTTSFTATSASIVMNSANGYDFRIGNNTKLTILTSAIFSDINIFAPSYFIGGLLNNRPLVSNSLSCCTIGSLAAAGVATNITFCAANPNGNLIGQQMFPVNVTINYIMGYSSGNLSTTQQVLTLQFFVGFAYTAPTFISPTPAQAQSIYIAGSPTAPINVNVNANSAWYANVTPNVASAAYKNWTFIIFYSQR